MDKAISFENGIRIGQAWLKDSGKKERPQDEAAVAREPVAAAQTAPSRNDAVAEAAEIASTAAVQRSSASAGGAIPFRNLGSTLDPQALTTPAEAGAENAEPPLAPSAGLPPMRGVTVGTPGAPQSGSRSSAAVGAVRGQTLAAVLALGALAPPLAASLILGLSHRAHEIPYASVWAWMATLIALGATARSALTAIHRATTAWLLPILLAVFLLLPAAIVLYFRLSLDPVPSRLAVVQIAVYAMSLAGLLLSSLAAVPE